MFRFHDDTHAHFVMRVLFIVISEVIPANWISHSAKESQGKISPEIVDFLKSEQLHVCFLLFCFSRNK